MFLSDRSGMRHTSEVRPGGYPEGRGRGITGSRPTRWELSSAPVSATWWTLSQSSKWKDGLGYSPLVVFLPDTRKVLGSTASITKKTKKHSKLHILCFQMARMECVSVKNLSEIKKVVIQKLVWFYVWRQKWCWIGKAHRRGFPGELVSRWCGTDS